MNKVQVLILFLFVYTSSFAQTEISGVINNYTSVNTIDADTCFSKLTVEDASLFSVGEKVILIQMQGATIDESNTSSFGTVNNLNNTGNYEINEIESIIGNDIYLAFQLVNAYNVTGKVQLINMPTYQNAEIVDTLTADAWDGSKGGILALKVEGQLFMEGIIDVSGLGFRGGIAQTATNNNCNWLIQQNDYYYDTGNWRGSEKGAGIAQVITGKEFGKGAQANGGGGGNDHNAGGGGGAHITNGGNGGVNDEPSTFGCQGNHPGIGGKGISEFENKLFLGGGGGAGHENNEVATDGGNGGGIVILIVNEFYPLGYSINSKGISTEDGGGDGGGGGGAGGTILLETQFIETTVHLFVNGGDGGLINNGFGDRCHGPGGGGSGGRIITNLTTGDPFQTILNGGQAGMSINSTSCNDGNNGAQDGQNGILEPLNSVIEASEIFLNPIADFTFATNGGVVDLTNVSSNANMYQWEFGDMNSSILESPTYTYTESGTFIIQLIATNHCGSDTTTQEVTINLEFAPTAAFTFDMENGCAPLLVNFMDASQGTVDSYEWTFAGGDPSTSNEPNPQVVYNTPGFFDVQLEVSGIAGADIILLENIIEVLPEPTADFSFNINGGTVTFSNLSTNINSSLWDFGDNNTDDLTNPSHTYSQNGMYTVQLIVENNCGMDTLSQTINIEIPDLPTAAFTLDDGSGCAPLLVNFSDVSSGTVNTYLWTFEGGNPSTSSDPNPQVLYTTPGIYNVQLEVTNTLGSDLVLMEDLIEIVPAVDTDFDFNINDLEVSFFTNTVNATDYQWNFGDGMMSTEENPVHNYTMAGTYEVTLAATSEFCGMAVTQSILIDFVDVDDLFKKEPIKIYPNPATDFLSIETEIDRDLGFQVFSIEGKELISFKQSFRNILNLDISSLPLGVYILKLQDEKRFRTFRLLVF